MAIVLIERLLNAERDDSTIYLNNRKRGEIHDKKRWTDSGLVHSSRVGTVCVVPLERQPADNTWTIVFIEEATRENVGDAKAVKKVR
jgi:hypothetical protein